MKEVKRSDRTQWHLWFAWHPVWTEEVRYSDGYFRSKRFFWEPVLRRRYYSYAGSGWDYADPLLPSKE